MSASPIHLPGGHGGLPLFTAPAAELTPPAETTGKRPPPHNSAQPEASNLWATPRDFLAGALSTLGLPPVALDLAAERHTTLASRWYGPGGEREDALDGRPWATPLATRWLNPPYTKKCTTCPDGVWRKASATEIGCAKRGHGSTDLVIWLRLAALEGVAPEAASSPIAALIPANTDTIWWLDAVRSATEVWLVSGRLHFLRAAGPDLELRPGGSPHFGSALLVWKGPPRGAPVFGGLDTAGRRVW